MQPNSILTFLIIICLIGTLSILQKGSFIQQNHYVGLAQSFLHGRFDIPNPAEYSATEDIASFKNKYYVYFGPTPAILILPFVFFVGTGISQHSISLIFFILDLFLIYKIARTYKISGVNCLWLTIFFMFGTIFFGIGLINFTSYQVQFIATSFLILALFEFFHQRRWFLIGLWLSLAVTTKPTFFLASIFFIVEILLQSKYWKKEIKNILLFSLPIVISLLILGYYNKARFDNFFDTGYLYTNVNQEDKLSEAVSHGFFSIEHIPGNLYFLLFKGPEPIRLNKLNYVLKFPYLKANPWGMGIFFTSPVFLYILLAKIKEKHNLISGITILLMLIPILLFYGIGIMQYGYRYALDFYPFLFLLLLSVFRNGVPLLAKILIVYGIIFNFFFGLSIWGIYPFL